MSEQIKTKLPVLALVNGVYAVIRKNPMAPIRAGLLPFLLMVTIGLWTTPESWGQSGYYAMNILEWVMLIALWTFYAQQLQRFMLKGSYDVQPQFLPRLSKGEGRFFIASLFVSLPVSAFALYYDQPLFFHQPDLVLMGGMVALDGTGELLYASLVAGWVMQLFAFVLPAIADDDEISIKQAFAQSFNALRQDFSRLFAASILVCVPVWLLIAMLRLVLYMPVFRQMAMVDEASALAWNLIFFALECLKVFVSGGLLAMVWALAYGRYRNKVKLEEV